MYRSHRSCDNTNNGKTFHCLLSEMFQGYSDSCSSLLPMESCTLDELAFREVAPKQMCAGERIYQPRLFVNQLPPILLIYLSHLETEKVIAYILDFSQQNALYLSCRYILVACTFWFPGHFTSAVYLDKPCVSNSGWYLYNDLPLTTINQGKNPPKTPATGTMSYCVYVKATEGTVITVE